MTILVVGGGGREHALGWALARSAARPRLLFAPGNAGTAALGENVPVSATDVDALAALARERGVDLTVVGPEGPLVAGLVDRFEAEGRPIVGPTAAAACLEGSKAFAKAFMRRHGIPTAAFRTFNRHEATAARAYVEAVEGPVVVKASGLAAGKGVVVCADAAEARAAVDDAFGAVEGEAGRFGAAGDEVVVEDFMAGEEASLFVLTDGASYALLPPAQDHKRLLDGDRGPNTGGMGAYSPAPVLTPGLVNRACREIVEPTLAAMMAEGHPFRGILYVGLMLTSEGPKVVEFNARLGDPETQAVLPLLETDLVAVFEALAHRRLDRVSLVATDQHAATVVLAAGGYPATPRSGDVITGLEEAAAVPGALVFHAGTGRREDGQVVTSGGCVLAVTGVGATLRQALGVAYEAAAHVRFEGMQLRRDIGHRALAAA
ncbi:MAG TPA: phosphoribosylamine--glycine ligase [Rhodothermales bacterium]|nr:phosphoribosylamine--glycine ligase [Rhodothermales bacterium]